jgi:murein DD-endopeptidase MepM/ murein hydrolase activator NlpD
LRRTFPQKIKPVPCHASEHELVENQPKQALPETNRRVRTSAAMIGLAISMGAYSLPLPQGDSASAAEPVAGESTTSTVSSFETAALYPDVEASQSTVSSEVDAVSIKHTVQEGQTIWDVARFYGADAATVAAANGITLDSVLRVGQVLAIPTDTRLAQAVDVSNSSAIAPGYYGLVSGRSSDSQTVASLPTSQASEPDLDLKAKQDSALEVLKQKRENLRQGLTLLNPAKAPVVPPVIESVVPVEQPQQASSSVPSTIPTNKVSEAPKVPVPSAFAPTEQKIAFGSSKQVQPAKADTVVEPDTEVLNSETYRVSRGDTLATIARAHGISIRQLAAANRVSDPNYIFVDQVLVIPKTQETATSQQEFRSGLNPIGRVSGTKAFKAVDVSKAVSDTNSVVITPSVGTEVAAAPSFTRSDGIQPAASSSESRLLQYNNIENLKLEIEKLREKHSGQVAPVQGRTTQAFVPTKGSRATSVTVPIERPSFERNASNLTSAERANPEFDAAQYSSLNSRIRELRERVRSEKAGKSRDVSQPLLTKPQSSKPQVVAAAPLGSESYDPLVQSRLGKTVSPELPSLGNGNEYLPGAPGKFAGYMWPTKGILTSGFGWRWGRMHKGIDIAGPIGTPIVAAADGVVSYAGWNSGGYGYLVEIEHADGSITLYAHNNRILVQVGQQVSQGQQVAEMGSTGYSTGPHLHFEVHPAGQGAVNPMALLPRS